jgi:hypothetical protein
MIPAWMLRAGQSQLKRNQKTETAHDNYQFVLHPPRFVTKNRASTLGLISSLLIG